MVQHFTFPFSYSLRPSNHICCLATVLWQYHNLGVTTMRDTVATACQVERDAVQGGWWSLQDVGCPSVPGDMGWLLWPGICCTATFTSLSGPSVHPSMEHPWWAHAHHPLQKVFDGGTTCHIARPCSLKGSHHTSRKILQKTLSGKTLLPTQRDVFVQRASTSRAHTDFPPPLCIHCMETIHDIF